MTHPAAKPGAVVEPLLNEISRPGRSAADLPAADVPGAPAGTLLPAAHRRRADAALPEVSELDLVRHFTRLSQLNFSIDTHFYPLGSCTMKYNPRRHEKAAALPGFAEVHPLQSPATVQGLLALLHDCQEFLAEIAGLDAVTLQPAAGAHGELTGLMLIKALLADRGDHERHIVLIPDSAHGTNPASAALCGLRAQQVRSDSHGRVDLKSLEKHLSDDVAAVMVTNPNTLGLFEEQIATIAEKVHACGGLVYMDGANLNAIVGQARPGDFGVDVLHINVHKTFTTPHGGGGPGGGPVAVRRELEPYLPVPMVVRRDGKYDLDFGRPKSIGKVKNFYGNIGMFVRFYTYIRTLGPEGVRDISRHAVLNANYLRQALQGVYELPYDSHCMHEFVLSAVRQKKKGVSALDIAKRLLDHGFHAPTIYFPLIVHEALMIEPTETESLETLDAFIAAMKSIAAEAVENPEKARHAPHTRPVTRLNEVNAARNPVVRWQSAAAPAVPPAPAR